MTTGQKYVGKASNALENPSAAQNAASTSSTGDNRQPCSIPAYLLNDEDNWELSEAIRIAQCPGTTGVNPTFVLAAIEAAFLLGKKDGKNSELLSDEAIVRLSTYSHYGTAGRSEAEQVYWGLEQMKADALKEYDEASNSFDEQNARIAQMSYGNAETASQGLVQELFRLAHNNQVNNAWKGGAKHE